jgi:hypothetical protein
MDHLGAMEQTFIKGGRQKRLRSILSLFDPKSGTGPALHFWHSANFWTWAVV